MSRKRKESGNGSFYTVLILPHHRSRFRKLRISRGFVITVAAVLGVALIAALYAPHLLFELQTRSAALDHLAHLRSENEQLREERDAFESRLNAIAHTLNRVETRTGHLATELGVESLPVQQPAAGGPLDGNGDLMHPRAAIDQELGSLSLRAERLDDSVGQLDQVFQERVSLLLATPDLQPVQGWFSHGFGWRDDPFKGGRKFHRGLDIVTDEGTPIIAPADGVVSRAIRTSDYGKTIDLSHGYGFVTRYGHLSELLVRSGQTVRRGQVIGRVGSTGRSTGPHLHYEVFRDGRRVNPWKYVGH